jgi:arginase
MVIANSLISAEFHPLLNLRMWSLIGIRDIDDRERRVIRESGITAFTMSDIDEQGMAAVSRKALEIVTKNTAGFHISFDVEGSDPTVIPESGTLVLGSVSFLEAHQLLENCAKTGKMVSMEVAELNPFLDEKNISAERTVLLIQSAFGSSILQCGIFRCQFFEK